MNLAGEMPMENGSKEASWGLWVPPCRPAFGGVPEPQEGQRPRAQGWGWGWDRIWQFPIPFCWPSLILESSVASQEGQLSINDAVFPCDCRRPGTGQRAEAIPWQARVTCQGSSMLSLGRAAPQDSPADRLRPAFLLTLTSLAALIKTSV